jgi:hypothetical protein
MAETENKYVKKISKESKQAIIDASVQSLSARPTSNATEMKKRFVVPIVNVDYIPSLADEVDRVASEADTALTELHDDLEGEGGVKERLTTAEDDIKVLQGHVSELSENDAEQSTRLETVEGKAEVNANNISTAERNIAALKETTSKDLGAVLSIDYDNSAYKLTIKLLNSEGATLGEAFEIDLPIESVVVSGEYLPGTKTLVLTLQNGNIINIPLGDIIDGFISSSEKGQPNGVASLDENGKVPAEQLPEGIGSGGSLPEGFNPEDYVKFTDYARADKAGVSKVRADYGISHINETLRITQLDLSTLSAHDLKNADYALTGRHLYKGIKHGITTNTETLTDDEKASACEWIGAVQRNPNEKNGWRRVYGMDAYGNETIFTVGEGLDVYSIPVRGVGGTVTVGEPTKDIHATTKKYVDDNFVAKMTGTPDSGATRGFAYGLDSYGTTQKLFRVQVQSNADTIPLRNPTGNFYVGTPTLAYECANKGYVDGEIATVNNVTARIFIHDDIDPSYTFLINVPKAFYEFYYMVPYDLAREYLKRVGATAWDTALPCTGLFNSPCGRVYYDEAADCIRTGTSPDQSLTDEYTEASLQLIDFYTE